ncbi:ankyrin repeat domain-containing protein [Yoonia maritima]|uniref:ankyrin repeat domain-containing protein n=1 Tax=Yoonia maritima TaxID=1435347 RepID=UPI000D0EB281|nr:ankyrin repeat domain-containing protein [Yoonia maritima]
MFKDEDLPKFEVVWEAFGAADISALEKIAATSELPHGVDPWSERYWLSHAIASGKPKSVEWVLSKGVDVHYVDGGFSALMDALQLEKDYQTIHKVDPAEAAAITLNTIDQLVAAGVDINQRLNLNYTAFHSAIAWSSITVIRHLLDLNADSSVCNTDHCTSYGSPVDKAKLLKRWDVHELLCEALGLAPSGRPLR